VLQERPCLGGEAPRAEQAEAPQVQVHAVVEHVVVGVHEKGELGRNLRRNSAASASRGSSNAGVPSLSRSNKTMLG